MIAKKDVARTFLHRLSGWNESPSLCNRYAKLIDNHAAASCACVCMCVVRVLVHQYMLSCAMLQKVARIQRSDWTVDDGLPSRTKRSVRLDYNVLASGNVRFVYVCLFIIIALRCSSVFFIFVCIVSLASLFTNNHTWFFPFYPLVFY